MALTNTVTGKMNYLTVGSNTYEIEDKNAAPLASPAFTGTPTAPTATAGTSTTQIATTKFVMDAMSGAGAGTVTSVGISNATNGGLSISGSPVTSSGTITVGHSNILTSAQTTQAIYPIKIDKNGHISAYGSAVTIPTKTSDLTNDSGFITSYTDEKLALAEVTSTVQYYPIVGTGTTASTRQCDTTGFIYIGTNGTTSTVGTANLTLGNATASGTVNNKRGQIYLYGTSTGRTRINTNVTSGTSVVSFPDKGGTVALTDDIPTVPTITLNGSSTTSPSFYAPTSAGTDGYVLKSNGSGAPSWTSAALTDINVQTNVGTSGNTYYLIGTSATSLPTTGVTYSSNTKVKIGTDTTTLQVGAVNFPGQIGLNVTSGGEGFYTIIKSAATAGTTITLPNATGTVALTSDIPDVSGKLDTTHTSGTVSGQANWNNGSLELIINESTYNIFSGIGINPYGVNLVGRTGSTDSITAQAMIGVTQNGVITLGAGTSEPIELTISDGYMAYDVDDYHVTFPTGATGTIALTSNIPSLTLNGSSVGASASWYAPTSAGTSGYYLKSNGSGAPSWASISIPSAGTSASAVGTSASGGSASTYSKSDHVHNITSSTITSALGYTPYNSTNPNGYVTTDINLQTTTYAPTTDSRTNECPLIFNAANTIAATGTKQSYTAVRYICVSGTKTASRISLGTPDTSGTADKYGAVRLYGTSSGYTDIVGSNNTSTTSYSVNIGNANGKLPVIKKELLTPSSGWTWRVWDSGLQEAWYHGSITFSTAGASYQGWYRSTQTISLPTGTGFTAFADTATVIASGAYNGHVLTSAGLVKTNGTELEVQILGGNAIPASTAVPAWNIYVCGFARS